MVQAVGRGRVVGVEGVPACSAAADAGGVGPQGLVEAWEVLPWVVFGHRIVVACYAEHHRVDVKTVVSGRGRGFAACAGVLEGVLLGGLVALVTAYAVTWGMLHDVGVLEGGIMKVAVPLGQRADAGNRVVGEGVGMNLDIEVGMNYDG